MFWKKKRASTKSFIHESSNKRETYRFEFDKNFCLKIEFKNKIFDLINLSATGVSFKNNELVTGDHGTIKMIFEFTNITSPVLMELDILIIKIGKNNMCHAIFNNSSEENREMIHKYILEKQKEKLRINKIK